MPESVEIPAPVRATTERASAIHWRTDAMTASAGAGSRDMGQFCHMTARYPRGDPLPSVDEGLHALPGVKKLCGAPGYTVRLCLIPALRKSNASLRFSD